jgi:hypothetical protein
MDISAIGTALIQAIGSFAQDTATAAATAVSAYWALETFKKAFSVTRASQVMP